jgi:hypothetical protein
MAWPRPSVYSPGAPTWYLQYFSLLLLGATGVLGAATFLYLKRGERLPATVGDAALAGAQA